jgi:hypothetical protein
MVIRNMCVVGAAEKLAIAQTPGLLQTLIHEIREKREVGTTHLMWAIHTLSHYHQSMAAVVGTDIRVETIRKILKSIDDVYTTFLLELHSNEKERVDMALKFLSNMTAGGAIPREIKDVLPHLSYGLDNLDKHDKCPICFVPFRREETVFFICKCSQPPVYWHKECLDQYQQNTCSQCGKVISYKSLL